MQGLGSRGILGIQYEASYGVLPTGDTPPITANLTKVYLETEGFKASRNLVDSAVITGVRHASKPLLGNIDVQGSLATELGTTLGMLFYGVTGSVGTVTNANTGAEAGGTALSPTAVTTDSTTQTMTLTMPSNVAAPVGSTITLGAAATINAVDVSMYRFRVVKLISTTGIICRIPAGMAPAGTGIAAVFTGANVKVGLTGGLSYTHTFKSGGILPSFVVEKGFTDIAQYFLYTGCKAGKMTLNLDPEAVQKITFDFTGKDEAIASTSYNAAVTDLGKNSLLGSVIASVKESGGTNDVTAKLTKLDVTLDNSLDSSIYCIGGLGKRSAITEGLSKVSGTATMIFENTTLYAKSVGGTKTDIVVVIKNGTGVGTVGNEQLTITIPELIFKQETPVIAGDKGLMVTLAFTAFYESGLGKTSLQLDLLNPAMTI